MIAAILRRHGLRTGAYLSPHLVSFGERIRIDDEDLEPAAFAAAVQRAAHAAELVDRSLGGRRPGDPVRGADRRRLLGARPSRRRGRGDRGGAGRPLRRHQRDPLAGAGADERRTRAHALARADDHRHRRREARRGHAGRRRSCSAPGCIQTRWRVAREVAAQRGATHRAGRQRPRGRRRRAGLVSAAQLRARRAAAEAYLGELDERAVAAAAAEIRVPGRLQIVGEEPADARSTAPTTRRGWRRWRSRCRRSSPAAIAWSRSYRSSTTRTPPGCSRR